MKNKNNFILLAVLTVFTIYGIYWFSKSVYFAPFNFWIQSNIILYSLCLFLIKAIGIVWPPISGGLFTVGSIPFLGWELAFFIDFMGSIVGGGIAYYLGSRYGYNFLNKVFDTTVVTKIRGLKIKKGKEVEAIFMYKVLFGVLIEAVYYGAGVLKVNYLKFMIGAVFGHLVVGVPSFYLAKNIFSGDDVLSTVILTIVGIAFITKTKGRYFE